MNKEAFTLDSTRTDAQRLDALAPQSRERDGAAPRAIPDDAMVIVPVRNFVLFPGMVVPLAVDRERSRAAVAEAVRQQRPVGILLQSKREVDQPGPDDLHWVGSTATILRYVNANDGTHHAICQGGQRFRVLQFLDGYPMTVARVQLIEEPAQITSEIEGRAHNLKERALEILRLLPQVPEELIAALQGVEGPARLADFIAGVIDVGVEEKQTLLEMFDLRQRLDKLLEMLTHRIEVLKVSREIDERTRESIGDRNREHLLREQLRTIQKELGEGDDTVAEIRRARPCDHRSEDARGSREAGAQGTQAPRAHAGGRRRILDGAHLSRLADRAAVGG